MRVAELTFGRPSPNMLVMFPMIEEISPTLPYAICTFPPIISNWFRGAPFPSCYALGLLLLEPTEGLLADELAAVVAVAGAGADGSVVATFATKWIHVVSSFATSTKEGNSITDESLSKDIHLLYVSWFH